MFLNQIRFLCARRTICQIWMMGTRSIIRYIRTITCLHRYFNAQSLMLLWFLTLISIIVIAFLSQVITNTTTHRKNVECVRLRRWVQKTSCDNQLPSFMFWRVPMNSHEVHSELHSKNHSHLKPQCQTTVSRLHLWVWHLVSCAAFFLFFLLNRKYHNLQDQSHLGLDLVFWSISDHDQVKTSRTVEDFLLYWCQIFFHICVYILSFYCYSNSFELFLCVALGITIKKCFHSRES